MLTKPEQDSNRVHLPRPVYYAEHGANHPHQTAPALYRRYVSSIYWKTRCLEALNPATLAQRSDEKIYVDTSDKQEERGGDGGADDTTNGSHGWRI